MPAQKALAHGTGTNGYIKTCNPFLNTIDIFDLEEAAIAFFHNDRFIAVEGMQVLPGFKAS